MSDAKPLSSDGSKKLRPLYPTPKTYDELRARQRLRELRRRRALPKFAPLRVALLTTALFAMWVVYVGQIMPSILRPEAVTAVGALFLVGFALILFTWLAYRRISDWYDAYGSSGRVFLVSYAVVLLVWFYAASQMNSIWPNESLLPRVAVHAIATYLVAFIAIGHANRHEHR